MGKFENKLTSLFDYQRFERNKDLQRVINNVQERYDSGAVLLRVKPIKKENSSAVLAVVPVHWVV